MQLFGAIPDARAIMHGQASPNPPAEIDAQWALVAALVGHAPTVPTLKHFIEYLPKLDKPMQTYAVLSAAPDTKAAWTAWVRENPGFISAVAEQRRRRAAL